MKGKIETLKGYHWLLTTSLAIIAGVISAIWLVFSIYNDFKVENEQLIETMKTTQQMSLKSVIWNDAIPLGERANACDVYLNAGYNSLTKRECEVILEKANNSGFFN